MTRSAFRALVEKEMQLMGWPPRSFLWASPGRFIVVVNGQMREMKLAANMGRRKIERQLGYLAGMADVLGLVPQ